MQIVLLTFTVATALLWLSVFGYILTLAGIVLVKSRQRAQQPRPKRLASLPPIAIVVPVLNEQHLIAAKLEDLRSTDYPAELLSIVIADGGSTDATGAIVRAAQEQGARVEWLPLQARCKAEQINRALAYASRELVVVTDVDARLDPACVRRLVETLVDDPQAAVAGARIRPETDLAEERLHWWAVNNIWWLEGEALSAGLVSGVCYAVRRAAIAPLPHDADAEDIHLALAAGARGQRVRLCRNAEAVEVRVPRTTAEFLRFRRRRGSRYARELRRDWGRDLPRAWRWALSMRRYAFAVTPKLAALVSTLAGALVLAGEWTPPLIAAAAFVLPALLALHSSTTLPRQPRLGLDLAAGRLVWLILVSLYSAARGRSGSTAGVGS